ncbi:MAG: hypothetical protein LBP19_02105 [Treponema sp.]|nr:hypothetical protein [Treponema sp.]
MSNEWKAHFPWTRPRRINSVRDIAVETGARHNGKRKQREERIRCFIARRYHISPYLFTDPCRYSMFT